MRPLVAVVFFALSSLVAFAASAQQRDRIISCPTQRVAGCHRTIDPGGQDVQPVQCLASNCKVRIKLDADRRRICQFSCPERFE